MIGNGPNSFLLLKAPNERIQIPFNSLSFCLLTFDFFGSQWNSLEQFFVSHQYKILMWYSRADVLVIGYIQELELWGLLGCQ